MCFVESLVKMKCKIEKFKTEEKAKRVAMIRQLKKRRTRSGHGRKYESYFCEECGYWHVGIKM